MPEELNTHKLKSGMAGNCIFHPLFQYTEFNSSPDSIIKVLSGDQEKRIAKTHQTPETNWN